VRPIAGIKYKVEGRLGVGRVVNRIPLRAIHVLQRIIFEL
jgi:hypothetical protein